MQPIVSAPVFSMQGFQHGVLLERLREREEMRFGTSAGVLVEVEEVIGTKFRNAEHGSSQCRPMTRVRAARGLVQKSCFMCTPQPLEPPEPAPLPT